MTRRQLTDDQWKLIEQDADSPQFVAVLQKVRVRVPFGCPRTRPDAVAADKA